MKSLLTMFLLAIGLDVLGQSVTNKPKAGLHAVQIGNSNILLPTPDGFFIVKPENERYFEYARLLTPKNQTLNAYFLQDSMKKHLSIDTLIYPSKYIRVQSINNFKLPPSLPKDKVIALFKETIKNQRQESIKQTLEKVNKAILDKDDKLVELIDLLSTSFQQLTFKIC